ncbi:hypothetical protein DEIPH_ctg013orf0039 [Deinococcus phoenicis]|uniref:Uncharacterized protein n=1 Tax=Deinococcus phoenicis TaxID=1476583 RepID=A0A016QS99_9DEIO|nr:hypothetical protein [Deinococcus phoenicis]EYB68933.1 hypothetical protein DEIPH_ctg013orf0039 [Deinococcus phoenicis]
MSDETQAADTTALISRYEPHRREKLKGMTKALYLPLLGQEVIIGRLSMEAYLADSRRVVLSIPAMREAAVAWSASVAEKLDDGKPKMPRGDLPPEVQLEVEREAQRALVRGALLRPPLEDLVEEFGGSLEDPDLGMADDFEVLLLSIVTFAKVGDAEREQTKSLSVAASRNPRRPRQ